MIFIGTVCIAMITVEIAIVRQSYMNILKLNLKRIALHEAHLSFAETSGYSQYIPFRIVSVIRLHKSYSVLLTQEL